MKNAHNPILTPEQVAKLARCSRSTVINYSNAGVIATFYESNGFRKFSYHEAMRLRQLLAQSREERGIGRNRAVNEQPSSDR